MLHTIWEKYRRAVSRRIPELQPFQAYQLWAETYDNIEENALLFAERKVLGPLIRGHDLNNKVVLDAGCGTGRNLEMLSAAKPGLLLASDLTPNMLERASAKYPETGNIFFQLARVELLPYKDAQFDFVLCTLVLGHVTNLAVAINELSRVLRCGGTMITSCFHPFSHRAGWQRTFKVNGPRGNNRLFAVTDYHHSHAEYVDAFQSSGCEIVRVCQPVIDESLRPFYQRAHRMDIFHRFKGSPLLLIFEVRKK